MSNPPDPNDHMRLLLLLQQQAQQAAARQQTVDQQQPLQGTAAPAPAQAGPAFSLGNMLRGLSNAPETAQVANESSAPAFFAPLWPNPDGAAAAGTSITETGAVAAGDATQQQQLLIASARLLVNVNPGLAAAAVEHAMNLAGRESVSASSNAVPSQIEQGNTHHHLTKKSSPTSSSNSSGNSNPSQQSSNSDSSSSKKSETVQFPPETNNAASVSQYQSWSVEKLKGLAQELKKKNQPIPDAVKNLLNYAHRKEQKIHKKRMSGRKFASASRARKNKLIADLTSSNRKLRRGALVLSYLPDPVVALDVEGRIKFCSRQMERVLMHKLDDLIGASIEQILVPKSRGTIRRIIQDLVTAEQLASGEVEGHRGNDSGDSSNDTNVLSRRSDQSFPLLEVNVDDQHVIGSGENVSDSSSGGAPSKDDKQTTKRHKDGSDKSNSRSTMSSLTQKPPSFFSEGSATNNSDERQAKMNKLNKNESSFSSNENGKVNHGININVDDVMGASVTANNAGAKLSSLMHYPKDGSKESSDGSNSPPEQPREEPHIHKKHGAELAVKQDSGSSSSTESRPCQRAGQNSSEDSGYRESNESSDSALDSSSTSVISTRHKERYRPLAPCCNVRVVRADLTTLWCELTLSIRTRHLNDEDSELGIIDLNPPADSMSDEPKEEKELLLCFRPFFIGKKVGEDLRFPPHQISESSNANGSGENGSGDITSYNKSSSGNDDKTSSNKSSSRSNDKEASHSGSEALSGVTQLNNRDDTSKQRHHVKKRSHDRSAELSSKKQCIEENHQKH